MRPLVTWKRAGSLTLIRIGDHIVIYVLALSVACLLIPAHPWAAAAVAIVACIACAVENRR